MDKLTRNHFVQYIIRVFFILLMWVFCFFSIFIVYRNVTKLFKYQIHVYKVNTIQEIFLADPRSFIIVAIIALLILVFIIFFSVIFTIAMLKKRNNKIPTD